MSREIPDGLICRLKFKVAVRFLEIHILHMSPNLRSGTDGLYYQWISGN